MLQRKALTRPRVLIIGVGNAYRGDDAVGLFAARQMQVRARSPRPWPNVSVVEASGEGAALIEMWQDADTVILMDAVQSGAPAGTIHRFDARAESLPVHFFHYSTHAFSVAEAIELARVLDQLPPRLIVYGIEGKEFGDGVKLSDEVIYAAQTVVADVARDILSDQILDTQAARIF